MQHVLNCTLEYKRWYITIGLPFTGKPQCTGTVHNPIKFLVEWFANLIKSILSLHHIFYAGYSNITFTYLISPHVRKYWMIWFIFAHGFKKILDILNYTNEWH